MNMASTSVLSSTSISMRLVVCILLIISNVWSKESPTWTPTATWWPTDTRWPTSTHYPTRSPTPKPTRRIPTDNPTVQTMTEYPTSFPTVILVPSPTESPTHREESETEYPTSFPTVIIVPSPTESPTHIEESETEYPTSFPTVIIAPNPTESPTKEEMDATFSETGRPLDSPTFSPSQSQTSIPTREKKAEIATSTPTLSSASAEVQNRWPSLMSQIAHQTLELASQQEEMDATFSETGRPLDSPTFSPSQSQTSIPTREKKAEIATSTPTLSLASAEVQNRWPSLMSQIAHQTLELASQQSNSPSTSPTIDQSESPTNLPTFDMPERLQFDYDPMSMMGPQHWGNIDVQRSKYFDFVNDKGNHCDANKQSPIDVTNKDTCADDHTFGKTKGQTKFSELKFEITPSGLRASFPDKSSAPRANWSNLSGNIPAVWFDIKMNSEHWLFGQQYAAEFQLYFDQSHDKGKDGFVILSIMIDDTPDQHNPQLEQFIREWEEESWAHQNDCDRQFDPTIPKRPRTYFNVLSQREIYDTWGLNVNDSDSRADFDIYRLVPTSWYCGYIGTLTSPPCSEKIHWRLMDIPISISRSQINRMQNLISNRLDTNCQKVTGAFHGKVNRPIQSERKSVWCCNGDHWPLRDKDPDFWYETWPIDYHGWKSYDEYILNSYNSTVSYQH